MGEGVRRRRPRVIGALYGVFRRRSEAEVEPFDDLRGRQGRIPSILAGFLLAPPLEERTNIGYDPITVDRTARGARRGYMGR